MRKAVFVLSAMVFASAATATPARAQLGGIMKKANKAVETKEKLDELNFTDEEEKQLGDQVSTKLRTRFGVYQNEPVTKYVSLVGGLLAQASNKPGYDWKFVVLDTDGVNAYAAPGGYIHITRGLLGLMKNESQLAGVLGHEITHAAHKHTVHAIQRTKGISFGAETAGGAGGVKAMLIAKVADKAFEMLFNGEFSRDDEDDADVTGAQLANKVGYSPTGMIEVLQAIADRNSGRQERNGLFASHPAIKDRIANIQKTINSAKLAATGTAAARYKQNITFDAKPIADIATNVEGASGLASGDKKKDDEKKEEAKPEEKKGGRFGLGKITGGSKQAQSSQQVASAGARGATPDRDAKGGSNPAAVAVKVSAADVDAFKKGIA